jgi:hypothetical protein
MSLDHWPMPCSGQCQPIVALPDACIAVHPPTLRAVTASWSAIGSRGEDEGHALASFVRLVGVDVHHSSREKRIHHARVHGCH